MSMKWIVYKERTKWLLAARQLRTRYISPMPDDSLLEESEFAFCCPNPLVPGPGWEATEPTARICESIAYSAEFWADQ